MKVLVVDDVELNRKLMKATLEAEGLEIFLAGDGYEALRVLESDGVDAIISDILMPNMDGYRLCYEIRNDPRFKSIPIVIYSASYTTPNDEKLALEFGANRFLNKACSTAEMMAAIRGSMNDPPYASNGSRKAADLQVMKEYSERLIAKLEERNVEMEAARQELLAANKQLVRRTQELRISEEKFRGIFENVQDVFFRTDTDGIIQMVSPSIERYGYGVDELIGSHLKRICPNADDYERFIQTIVSSRVVGDFEIILNKKDGSNLVGSISARALHDGTSAIPGVEGLIRDITDRKHLEEQLLQSQRMEAIGRLAGGVAHDFNNLLTAILGFASLALLSLPEAHPIRSHIEEIERAGNRAASLTNQLLVFSRRQVVQPRVLDLNSVVSGVETMLRRLIGEDIELTTRLAPRLASVKADPNQIEQILLNLAVNSRDAMPEGGKLTLETQEVTLDESYTVHHVGLSAGQYVMLAVSDTGCGIHKDVQSSIFEPFFTTKEVGKGTGLGLSTVYGIVKQSKGHLALYSEPGVGSCFKIYLPKVGESTEAPSKLVSGDIDGGSETILLVEDEDAVRKLARLTLQSRGYNVIEASDPARAVEISEGLGQNLDLVITDVIMPGSSGPKLADRLLFRYPHLKVLFISGYTNNAILQEHLSENAFYLQKPFTPISLAQRVREILDAVQLTRNANQ
jgi:two-component system cell cycle sensor histidine kinase/response regulator CckA